MLIVKVWSSTVIVKFMTDFESFFGVQQESVEATAEVSKTFNDKIRKYCDMTLLSCAYAGTGNVLKVFIEALQFPFKVMLCTVSS